MIDLVKGVAIVLLLDSRRYWTDWRGNRLVRCLMLLSAVCMRVNRLVRSMWTVSVLSGEITSHISGEKLCLNINCYTQVVQKVFFDLLLQRQLICYLQGIF